MKNLIGYEWKDASDGATIEVTNPATNQLIATVPNVTEQDVDEAVKVAVVEQKKWAEVSIYERAEILYKFVDLVEANKDRLARLLSDETGKPIKEAYGEIANVKIGVRAFVEKAKHLYNESIPAGQEAGQDHPGAQQAGQSDFEISKSGGRKPLDKIGMFRYNYLRCSKQP